MRWLFDLRLSIKFGFMVIFILGVMTAAIAYVNMRAYYQYQLENLREKAQTTGDLLAGLAREPYQQRDHDAMEQLLRRVTTDRDLVYAAIWDAGKQLIAEVGSTAATQGAQQSNSGDAPQTANLIPLRFPIGDGAQAGELVLGLSHTRIDANHGRTLRELLLTTLLIIGGLCLVIFLDFLYIVLRPIRHLLTGMQRVTGGELNGQVRKFYDDEIGGLTDAFNGMMRTLNTLLADKDALTHTAKLQAAELAARVAEGKRIMRDLHDDVGAQLLTLIHRADSTANAAIARHALHNLRETIRGLAREISHVSLGDALEDWRDEARDRLDAAKITLHWQQPENIPTVPFSYRQQINLGRILRETLSNTIKHAAPGSVQVRAEVDADGIRIRIDDDGRGSNPQHWQAGTGLSNMRTRAREIGADLHWYQNTNQQSAGTEIYCPLRAETPACNRL